MHVHRLVLAALAAGVATICAPSDAAAKGRAFDTAVDFGNGKAFFFRGGEYVRYDLAADKADFASPRPIAGNWRGLFPEGIDAAFNAGNGKVYFFRGDQYIRWNIAADRADDGYPQAIAKGWKDLWPADLDAAFAGGNGKAYFVKGDQYLRWDIASDRKDPGYPKPIAGSWRGAFDDGIDAGFHAGNGKVHLFRGDRYARFDIKADRADPDYPRPIAGHWPGVWGHDAAARPMGLPEGPVAEVPSGTPEAPGGMCSADYFFARAGGCEAKPAARRCLDEVVQRVRSAGLESLPTGRLTLEQARDVVIAMFADRRVQFPPKQGFEPRFDAACKVVYPPQLASPSITARKPPPYGSKQIPLRMAIQGDDVAGVRVRHLWQGADQRKHSLSSSRTPTITNLEIRMVVGLVRLAEFLRGQFGATTLYHSGITSAEGHHYESGTTIDFIGACGGRLGACGDAKTAPAGLFVGDDWGHRPVAPGRAAPGDPNYWDPKLRKPGYRLDLPGANPQARDFFRALYGFFMRDYRDRAASLGEVSFIITPDDGDPDQRRSGKLGHREHVHAELGDVYKPPKRGGAEASVSGAE